MEKTSEPKEEKFTDEVNGEDDKIVDENADGAEIQKKKKKKKKKSSFSYVS